MTNIVYLLGAGASAQALPVVNQIPNRLEELIRVLSQEENSLSENESFSKFNSYSKREIQRNLIEGLDWLRKKCLDHASIDTFAKKLYLTGNENELDKLKQCLAIFLIWEECSNKPDGRYDTFWASILSDGITSFPGNIQILSWNYDTQFEMSYMQYLSESLWRIVASRKRVNIINDLDSVVELKSNNFRIVKLNGSTDFWGDSRLRPYNYIDIINQRGEAQIVDSLVDAYSKAAFQKELHSNIRFAWEARKNPMSIGELASQADILIVIGYSFPFFNREVDRAIINGMTNLNKVYIQDMNPQNIKERFFAVLDDQTFDNFHLTSNVDQFVLPNEL